MKNEAPRGTKQDVFDQRHTDEENDHRWAGLYGNLRTAGIPPKAAAFGATAVVFGLATALLLYP